MKNKKSYIILTVIVMIAVMIWNVANEPGIKDLRGNFKEVAFVRNEQNSGPVIRVYAVTVKGEPWDEMEQYGNYMPHTKYGTTRVFFFREDRPFPSSLSLAEPHISSELKPNCIAVYEKDGMSQVKLQPYPFGT
jgi:hypothetical protein